MQKITQNEQPKVGNTKLGQLPTSRNAEMKGMSLPSYLNGRKEFS